MKILYVKYVNKPLQTLYTKGFVDRCDDVLLAASGLWQIEDRQQQSTGISRIGLDNYSEDAVDDIDELLLAASQQFEQQNKGHRSSLLQQDSGEGMAFADEIDDKLLLAASQQFENQLCGLQSVPVQPEAMSEGLRLESDGDVSSALPCNQFASLSSFSDIERVKESRIPSKIKANTAWATNIWREWAVFRVKHIASEESTFNLDPDIERMEISAVSFWLQRFVLEVRKANKEHYCPDSLYQLCCGLQRALRNAINFFDQFQFSEFRAVVDGELKKINATGKFVHKKKAKLMSSLRRWKISCGKRVFLEIIHHKF